MIDILLMSTKLERAVRGEYTRLSRADYIYRTFKKLTEQKDNINLEDIDTLCNNIMECYKEEKDRIQKNIIRDLIKRMKETHIEEPDWELHMLPLNLPSGYPKKLAPFLYD